MVAMLAQQNRWVSFVRLHVVSSTLMLSAISSETTAQLSVFEFLNSLARDIVLGSSVGYTFGLHIRV